MSKRGGRRGAICNIPFSYRRTTRKQGDTDSHKGTVPCSVVVFSKHIEFRCLESTYNNVHTHSAHRIRQTHLSFYFEITGRCLTIILKNVLKHIMQKKPWTYKKDSS